MKKLTALILLVSLFACTSKEDDVENLTVCNLEEVKASDIFSESNEVELLNSDTTFISDIRKILISGNSIFIKDVVYDGLYIYDFNGNLTGKFYRKGRGPGEYLSFTDFLIDETNKTIEILDDQQKKILIYSLDDYRYLSSISESLISVYRFAKSGNSYYFQTNGATNMISDKETRSPIISFTPPSELNPLFADSVNIKENVHLEFPDIFYKSRSGVIYASMIWDTFLYCIDNGKLRPFMGVDQGGEHGIPKYLLKEKNDVKERYIFSSQMDGRYFLFKTIYAEGDNFVICFGEGSPPAIRFIIRVNGKTSYISKINNDFSSVSGEKLEPLTSSGEYLISVRNTKEVVDKNPVVILSKLKDSL